MKTYTFFSDAGHGWLRVPYKDIIKYNLQDSISGYSYVFNNWVYLEEDSDMVKFLKVAGYITDNRIDHDKVNIKHKYSNYSRIRSFYSYRGFNNV